jgi:two-component system, LytTR family, sensor histidine kinase AgrC
MKHDLAKRFEKMINLVWLFYIAQVMITITGLIYYFNIRESLSFGMKQEDLHNFIQPVYFSGVLILLLIINGYFLLKDRYFHKRLQVESENREASFKNVEQLNRDLRAQRHDFLNHIQVLYSLMELKEYEETATYLNHLYGDIIKIGSRIKTESVSVNALLQAKSNEADKKNIIFDLMLKSRLENLPIGDWELCRILGNLIDNAFEALEQSKVTKKVVTLQIYEGIKHIDIRVRNNGPFIDEKLVNHIFEAGVSTKENKEDHGMGLYIVRQLLEDEGHSIRLEQEADVCFHISLKK